MSPYDSYKYGEQRYMQISKDNLVDPNNALNHLLTKYNPNQNLPNSIPPVVKNNNSSTPSKTGL